MSQTYQGYFEKGRFISREAISIPDKVEVHITLVDDTTRTENMFPPNKNYKTQLEWWDKFFISMDKEKVDEI